MELNGFNSDNYIYLKLNNDFESKNYDLKKGRILRFLRSNLEDKVYSRLISQGISEGLQYNRKKEVLDADILPHQVNNSISFKENTRASLILWPHERYCLNDWMMEHLTNSEEFERDFSRGFYGKCKDINLDAIKRGCIEALPDKNRLPMIEVGKDNVELIFNFKKGEELDFQDPGVMSLLIDHEMGGLLSNSSVIEGKEKDELFISDFQNAFFDSDGISDDDDHCIYHYYKVNDDIKAKSFTDFPYIYVNVASYDTEGFINYIYMETFSRMDFSRYWEETIKEFAQEVPLEDAKIMHRERLRLEKIKEEEQMKEWEKEEKERKKRLVASYEENKNDATIFPGTHGEFVQHCEYSKDKEDKYTLEEIKNFYTKLQSINVKALDYMYFYGGTIPYMIANAETSREFGDVDIFVPIEAMNFVREELAKQPTFEIIFDSKRITEGCNLTSHLPEVDVANRKESNGIELIFTFLRDIDENDQTHLENYFTRNEGPKVYQDFGFKGKLFGVNISIFPVYQYKSDLMAKSFNITNMYNYLLAVRVMNNMNIKDFAKNIQINGNKINILPVEYVLISKESAIDQKYVKRMEKDKDDVAFIEKNKEAIGIDEELMEKLRSNYPDYSIALAYYVYDNFVKKISGERYKELMLLNNGEYLS